MGFGLCCQRAIGGSSIAALGAGKCIKGGAARVSLAGAALLLGGFFRGKGESACVISHKSRLRRGIPLSGVVDIVAPISARQPMSASY